MYFGVFLWQILISNVVQLITFLSTLIVFDRIDCDQSLIYNDEEAFQFLNGNGKLYARVRP